MVFGSQLEIKIMSLVDLLRANDQVGGTGFDSVQNSRGNPPVDTGLRGLRVSKDLVSLVTPKV